MKQKLLILPITFLFFLLFATPAFAQGPGEGQVIFGSNLTVETEETVEGDVVAFGGNVTTEKFSSIEGNIVVFGGNVTAEEASIIEGDLAVFGGNINIDGTAQGDMAALGGNVNVGETAVIEGDIVLLGGQANIDEGAAIKGNIVRPFSGARMTFDHDFDIPEPSAPPVQSPPRVEPWGWTHRIIDLFADLAWTVTLLIGLAAISWLVATFMPEQMKQVGDTIADSGAVSFGLGLLTVVLSIVIGIPLLITICLAFIPILAYILIGIAVLFGWLVVGQMIGERLLIAAGRPYPNFVFSTVVGVVVLTVIAKMPIIDWVPCIGFIFGFIGWMIGTIVALTGLGAVILTRFGTRPYTPRSYSGAGGSAPTPSTAPYTTDTDYTDEDFSDLDINSASEAELRAKIKAALTEADEPAIDTEPVPEKPKDEPTFEDTPEPEQPDKAPPDRDKPDENPDSRPDVDT